MCVCIPYFLPEQAADLKPTRVFDYPEREDESKLEGGGGGFRDRQLRLGEGKGDKEQRKGLHIMRLMGVGAG